MIQLSSGQAKGLLSVVLACIFGVVSLALGFGLVLSIASAAIGAISGGVFIGGASRQLDPPSYAELKKVFRSSVRRDGQPMTARAPAGQQLQESGRFGRLLADWSEIFLSGSPYQRVASRVFLVQALIGLFAIFVFWGVEAAGLNMDLIRRPSLLVSFGRAFPINASSSIAKARFDNLFLPLASFFVISLSTFAVAFLGSLAPIIRNFRQYWLYLFVPVLALAFCGILLDPESSRYTLHRMIVDGHVWGYLTVFVLYPLFLLLMTASLPSDRSR